MMTGKSKRLFAALGLFTLWLALVLMCVAFGPGSDVPRPCPATTVHCDEAGSGS